MITEKVLGIFIDRGRGMTGMGGERKQEKKRKKEGKRQRDKDRESKMEKNVQQLIDT